MTSAPLTIRKAQPADASLLSTLGHASYIPHFAHLWHQPSELEAFLKQEYAPQVIQQSLESDAGCWLIAQTQQPVGFAKVSWHCAVGDAGPAGTLLHKLYLLPEETGKGYGEQLIDETIRLAQARGEIYFWLEVLEDNLSAYRFYTRQGFIHLTDTLFTTPSQQKTLHVMGKSI